MDGTAATSASTFEGKIEHEGGEDSQQHPDSAQRVAEESDRPAVLQSLGDIILETGGVSEGKING